MRDGQIAELRVSRIDERTTQARHNGRKESKGDQEKD